MSMFVVKTIVIQIKSQSRGDINGPGVLKLFIPT
jgi:hypothetical protein